MLYTFDENGAKQIDIADLTDDKLTIGYLNTTELLDNYQSFKFAKSTVDMCLQPSELFRSGVEVYEDYTFTELKIINVADVSDEEDCLALYIKKNLFVVIDINDYDNSTKTMFNESIKKYNSSNATLEKLIYSFLGSLISTDGMVIEELEDSITLLEKSVLNDKSNKDFSQQLFEEKRALSILHNYYEQILDITEALLENENDIFVDDDLHYISNISNKVVRLREDIDTLRSSITHLQDAYSTHIDLQLNKTMKVFTAVATIFLPLTLITGWFGMNFDNMPSLNSEYGYLICIVATILTVVILSVLGKVKKWWG